jgi:hypothetical protein
MLPTLERILVTVYVSTDGYLADGQNHSQVFFVQMISGQMPERESHFDIVID